MANYGRYGDDQTRDRESSRFGRGMDEGQGWGRSQGTDESQGWGRSQGREEDRGWGRSRGMGQDQGWGASRDRDEEQGWGRGRGMDENRGRDRSRGGESRSGSMFGSGWGGQDRDRDQERSRDRDQWRESRHSRGFGSDDGHEGLPIDETSRLIASNKVEGTAVYARDGARLGSIYNFMVDKRSGKVEYAVMSYGGFLGMGTRYYPLPWDILSYDTRLGGYHVEMIERDLERAPSFDRSSEPSFDTSYGRRVRGWYGLAH